MRPAAGYIVLVAYELYLLNEYSPDVISYWLRVPLQLAT